MNKLSLRLETILSIVPTSDYIADIGADHGLVSIELIKRGIAKQVFAVENKKGPYTRLIENINNNNLSNRISTSLSSGISLLPFNITTVIIAGMGGKLICDILSSQIDKLENIEYLVIDAHSDLEELRKKVVSLGYEIIEEKIIYEDKVFYEIILFKKGIISYSDDEYRYGPLLIKEKSNNFINKWSLRIQKDEMLLLDQKISKKRKQELIDEINRIKKYL